MKIGVFDSGIGGLTVLAALKKKIKNADFIYLGDTAHVPYGTKSPAQIRQLSQQCARWFKSKKVDILVVACNTASSLAMPTIRKVMRKTPVIGMVEPGVQSILNELKKIAPNRKQIPILILATRATIKSGSYKKALKKFAVFEQPCPLLVPMIEEGWIHHPILYQTIREYVFPTVRKHSMGIALLACTHYPWIQKAFEHALPGWKIVNSAQAVARALTSVDEASTPSSKKSKSKIHYFFTDPDAIPEFARSQTKNQKKADLD